MLTSEFTESSPSLGGGAFLRKGIEVMDKNTSATMLAICITVCFCFSCMTSCESNIIKKNAINGYDYNGFGSIPKFTKQEQD